MIGIWTVRALCRAFPNLPWIGDPAQRSPASTLAMTAVCHACPVFTLCAQYAEGPFVTSGFWAGQDRQPGLPRGEAA